MLHPGAGGWFTQQHWPLTPQSHRWTAHYYYHEPVNMTERLAIAQATAFARDSGMEDFMNMARQQKGLASEIGRASGGERLCQYVSIPGVAVTLKKNKNDTPRP